jgi:thioesterase domain-containing protein
VSAFLGDISGLSGKCLSLPAADYQGVGAEDLLRLALGEATNQGILPQHVSLSQIILFYRIFRSNLAAARNYRPARRSRLPQKTVLLRAAGREPGSPDAETLGWETLVGGCLSVREVPGTHYSILRRPNVNLLAEALGEFIDRPAT